MILSDKSNSAGQNTQKVTQQPCVRCCWVTLSFLYLPILRKGHIQLLNQLQFLCTSDCLDPAADAQFAIDIPHMCFDRAFRDG